MEKIRSQNSNRMLWSLALSFSLSCSYTGCQDQPLIFKMLQELLKMQLETNYHYNFSVWFTILATSCVLYWRAPSPDLLSLCQVTFVSLESYWKKDDSMLISIRVGWKPIHKYCLGQTRFCLSLLPTLANYAVHEETVLRLCKLSFISNGQSP